nr:MAG TPA: hypothetical protein [Caudoviricetes sp.]
MPTLRYISIHALMKRATVRRFRKERTSQMLFDKQNQNF